MVVMVGQDEFVRRREADWKALDALLERYLHLHRHPPGEISHAAALYRALCADLMRARSAGYGPALVAHRPGRDPP